VKAGFGVRTVLVLIGFTAAIAQIVLLRELMVVFYGNESSIGLMLGSWLFWTAAGSSLAGRLAASLDASMAARAWQPRHAMAGIQVLVAAVLPCTVLAVRAAKGLLQTVPGEVLGPAAMLLTSFCALGPLCILSGALFTAGSKVYAATDTAAATSAGEATGSVYLWEAVGSAGGGVVAGLILVRHLSSLEIALLLAVLNLLAASGLAIAARPLRYAAMGGLVGFALLLGFIGWPRRLEAISQERFWRGQHLVATRNSVYGSLAVVGTEGSRSVYENGVVLFNVPDPAAAEEAVHYALLEHPSPRSLLLIGGGLNGSIAQALRHPTLERVDYVELDPAILDLAREYFPNEWLALRANARVHVHVTDGRLFLKTTQSTFDVVIVNLPEPQNAQLNRFYTVEFFREASRKLTATGLLSFQLRSSEDYIGPELGQFLRSIHQSLRAVFPEVTAIPGETVHFFAAKRAGTLASGADELLARLHARNLQTSYVSEYFIPFRMTPDRMADLHAQFRPGREGTPPTPVNRDFAPVAYYFDIALWSSQFGQGYRRLFGAMAGVSFGAMAATGGVVLALLVVGGRLLTERRRRHRLAAGFCTAATGFTTIGLEMLLLLAFQAVYGYLYQQLAVVIAAFMAGMALGSWLGMVGQASAWGPLWGRPLAGASFPGFSASRPAQRGMRVLGLTQVLAAAAPLVLLGLCEAIGRAGTSSVVASQIAFPALAMACGMLGGYEFLIASRIFFAGTQTVHRPGTLYALDLAGSCLGAVLFSAWLVPVFGFLKTALLSAMVSLAAAAMAMLAGSETDPAE
jgi:spermidine synthase